MANVSFTTKTYNGQDAQKFVAPAILAADTIANNYIEVMQNVRFKANLRKVTGGTIGARSCEFNNAVSGGYTGSLDISDIVLQTSQLQMNEQICNQELAETWSAVKMRGAAAGAPQDLVSYLGQYAANIAAKQIELNLWGGNYTATGAASLSLFDGLAHHLQAVTNGVDDASLPLHGADTDVSNTGILDALAALVAGAPNDIMGQPDTKIFMSRKSANLYYQALAATYNLPFLNDGVLARYAGYDIVIPAGCPDDFLLMAQKSNLYFGCNLLSDQVGASFLNLTGVTGDDVTRIVMLFDCGTQIVDAGSCSIWRLGDAT